MVEQFNGHFEANVLGGCWVRPRGLVKKATMVFVGLIGYNVKAIRSFVAGEVNLKSVSKYWVDQITTDFGALKDTPNQWNTRVTTYLLKNNYVEKE